MRVLTFVVTCDYIDFWTLCFAHHFVYCCHFTRFLIKFFACLYLTTMQILWARKYEYGVLFITHAREIFKSLVFDSWLENFSSICDEQNTILTFPPHSIYTLSYRSFLTKTQPIGLPKKIWRLVKLVRKTVNICNLE